MHKYHLTSWISPTLFLLLSGLAMSQTIPFDSERWQIEAKESRREIFKGRQSLLLLNGSAILKDSSFLNGIIEFDMAFPEARGFTGVFWRGQNGRNFEHFYLRPHQSGNVDANQYTPVFNGIAGWQLYHGAGYGAAIRYPFDEWFHVKVVIADNYAEIYISDMETPLFVTTELKRASSAGLVGFTNSLVPTHFANCKITEMARPVLQGRPPALPSAPPGTVMSWNISSPVREKMLEAPLLPEEITTNLTWQKLACEATGVANLARLHGVEDELNTVFAEIIVLARQDQIKKIAFGYSDRVRIFLNGQQIYAGSNDYRSRDYRYLGTIGYFDTLYLPLKQGRNELWFAVSESFGGWGLQARFEDPASIELQ